MQKLLIATKNQGKIKELEDFLSDLPVELVSLTDAGNTDDVEEDGKTYEENSQKKALFYARESGLPAVADDGGLEISALGGKPGVHSRRWLGYEATDEELINHLMVVAQTLPDNNREAFFKAVVSLALPDGRVFSVAGEIKGSIPKEPDIEIVKGYPFRSFFYLPQLGKFYHENKLTPEEMKQHNHRYLSVQKLKPILLKELGIKN